MSTLSVTQQKLQVSDVKEITVSDIIDTEGTKLRVVRFFGDPVVNEAPTLILEVAATSDDDEKLKIATPSSEF